MVDIKQGEIYALGMEAQQEKILVNRAQGGCEQSFASLVTAHMAGMVRLAYRMVGNRADAEEIAQEAFIRLHRSLSAFRGESRINTWLYRTVTRLSIDYLRHEKIKSKLFLWRRNEDEPDPMLNAVDYGGNPAQNLLAHEQATAVAEAYSSLPPRQKAVLTLRQQEGMPLKEIAEILQISEGSIKTHLHRAVQALRSALVKLEEQDHVER